MEQWSLLKRCWSFRLFFFTWNSDLFASSRFLDRVCWPSCWFVTDKSSTDQFYLVQLNDLCIDVNHCNKILTLELQLNFCSRCRRWKTVDVEEQFEQTVDVEDGETTVETDLVAKITQYQSSHPVCSNQDRFAYRTNIIIFWIFFPIYIHMQGLL